MPDQDQWIVPAWVARRKDLTPFDRWVLACLLWRQGQNGASWPSTSRVADDLGSVKRAVIRSMLKLESVGLLRVERRFGAVSKYSVTGDSLSPVSDSHRCQIVTPTGDSLSPEPVTRCHPEPIKGTQKEEPPSLTLGLEGGPAPKPAAKRKPRIGSDTLQRETGALKAEWDRLYEKATNCKYVALAGEFVALSRILKATGYEETLKCIKRFLYSDDKYDRNNKSIRRFCSRINAIRAEMSEEPDDFCVR